MKIRNGFVSNSSSSSFIMRGVNFKTKNLIKPLGIDLSEAEKILSEDELEDLNLNDLIAEKLDELDDSIGIMCQEYEDDGNIILGTSLGSVENGEIRALEDDFTKIDDHIKKIFDKIGIKKYSKICTYIRGTSPG